jgi:hypothetical protein
MSSPTEPQDPVQEAATPADISGVIGLLNRHRSEIDRNFEAIVGMLSAQKERHLKTMQIQRRWNYGLATALVIETIFVIVIYWRG